MERAAQLKKQQKVLREQEWNAKPEYEKRVVSLDLVGGKVIKRMREVERPRADDVEDEVVPEAQVSDNGSGTFGRNPLLGNLVRPIWKGKGKDAEEKENEPRQSTWRRVQDDNDDNEAWILDGGVYGSSRDDEQRLGDEEHAYG